MKGLPKLDHADSDRSGLLLKKLASEDKKVLVNEMNIEKLKDLVVLLNKEIITYRKQVSGLGKFDNVMHIFHELDAKYKAIEQDKDILLKKLSSIEKDKAYTKEMVGRVHDISDEVNQKFDSFKDNIEAVKIMQDELNEMSALLKTTAAKTEGVVVKGELHDQLESHREHVDYKIREMHDNVHKKTFTKPIKSVNVQGEDVELTNVILDKDSHVTSEIEGIRQFADKNFHGEDGHHISKRIDKLEKDYYKGLNHINSHDHKDKKQIHSNHSQSVVYQVDQLRKELINKSVHSGKVQKFHDVIKNRQIQEASDGHKGSVDITLKKHTAIEDEFHALQKELEMKGEVEGAELDRKEELIKDTVDLSPESLDQFDDDVGKLHDMVDNVSRAAQEGRMDDAGRLYTEAMDFYMKLRESDKHDLEKSYDALVGVYERIMG